MSKTEATLKLEKMIWDETNKLGIFGCFEVTIGWAGCERVDYLTYDTKGVWRCYEIKVSKADFHSKAKKTFIGHYNYYVMPNALYEEVKEEIPKEIGAFTDIYHPITCVKRPKKQPLGVDEQILKNSLIRSLSRENEKFIKTGDTGLINRLKSKISKLEKDNRENHNRYLKCYSGIIAICDKYQLDYNEIREFVQNFGN